MRKLIENTVFLACVVFVFWPWMMLIVEAIRWFFHLAPLLAWDADRYSMAAVWPIPALIVVVFCAWMSDFFYAIRP